MRRMNPEANPSSASGGRKRIHRVRLRGVDVGARHGKASLPMALGTAKVWPSQTVEESCGIGFPTCQTAWRGGPTAWPFASGKMICRREAARAQARGSGLVRERVRPIGQSTVLACVMLVSLIAGCPPSPTRIPPAPLTMQDAARIVNDNAGLVTGVLRATGPVSGYVTTDNGRRRTFDLDGTLFCLRPSHMRFDLKSIAGTEILVGANDEHFWSYNRLGGDVYHCRPLTRFDEWMAEESPIRPDRIVEALGLGFIPTSPMSGEGLFAAQRVVDEYQQILFIARDSDGRLSFEKEYWLDRYPPRLVRRVVFRDANGVVEMESALSDYARLSSGGPVLPRLIETSWPKSGSRIRFHVKRWKSFDGLGPDSPQFVPPHKLGLRYENEDIVE